MNTFQCLHTCLYQCEKEHSNDYNNCFDDDHHSQEMLSDRKTKNMSGLTDHCAGSANLNISKGFFAPCYKYYNSEASVLLLFYVTGWVKKMVAKMKSGN